MREMADLRCRTTVTREVMMNRQYRNRCRKILRNSVIMINGTLLCVLLIPLCALLVVIDIVWLMMNGVIRKLEREE